MEPLLRFPLSNPTCAHASDPLTDFISRRRIALETERQEISVYTSPLTVLSYFVLYLLHEFRMALLWIVSQQYLLLVLPLLTAAVYFVYQTDGAHQPVRLSKEKRKKGKKKKRGPIPPYCHFVI